MFEPDSNYRTSGTLIELAVPTIYNLLSATGTNPLICVDQPEVQEGLSMSTRDDWTGHLGQDWMDRTGLGKDRPTRVKEEMNRMET